MKMPKKRTAAQRRAKQAAKRHSAASNKSGKHPAKAKASVGRVGNMRGLKPPPPSELQFVEIEKPI
jgi:sRNA-binding protein